MAQQLLDRAQLHFGFENAPLLPGITLDELLERTNEEFTLDEAKEFIRTLTTVIRLQWK